MKVLIVTVDKTIGIGDTVISGVTTSMSWVPSDVHAVNWAVSYTHLTLPTILLV